MTHVDFLIPNLGLGGQERMTVALAQALYQRGVRVRIIACQTVDQLAREEAGAEIEVLSLEAPTTLRAIPRLADLLRRSSGAWLVPISTQATVVAVAARSRSASDIRIAASVRGFIGGGQGYAVGSLRRRLRALVVDRWLGVRALRRSDVVMAVSLDLAASVRQLISPDGPQVYRVSNPALPLELPQPRGWHDVDAVLASRLGGRRVVIAVGRLVRSKGFDLLIRALGRRSSLSDVHLVIIGDGPERSELETLAEREGRIDRVHFLGSVRMPLPYVALADVLAAPSWHEGFGNVLVEALAVGTQVVGTTCLGGPHEILMEGAVGRLVAPGDVAALAEALEDSLCHPIPDEMLRAAAERYSPQSAARELVEILGLDPMTS